MTTPSPDLDTRVRLEIFRGLVETTRPPTLTGVSGALGLAEGPTAAAFERLAAGRAIVLNPRTHDIWMANPFSCVATGFEVESGGKRWFGNCIWDSFGVLALLGHDGLIRTTCPDCDDPLEVRVEDGKLKGDPGTVHFAVPAARWWDDIGYT